MDPTPGNMFIQFVPKKATGLYPYKGISLTFPDGVNLSLSCSCRLCGVDFFEYLTDVINRVAAMGPKATADTCRDLLPDKWEKK